MKNVPWTALQELKGDADVLKKLDEKEPMKRPCSSSKRCSDGPQQPRHSLGV